jgi:hypothetical protein
LKTTSTDIVNLLFSFWEPAAEAEGGLEAGHVGTDDVYRKVIPVLKCMGLLVSSKASSIKEFRLSIKSQENGAKMWSKSQWVPSTCMTEGLHYASGFGSVTCESTLGN